jgi:hypothetical protein
MTTNPTRCKNTVRRLSSAMANYGLGLGSISLDTRDIGSLWWWESKTQVAGIVAWMPQDLKSKTNALPVMMCFR